MSSSDSVRNTFRSGTVSAGRVQNLLDEPDRVPKSQFFDHLDRRNGVLLGAIKLGFGYSVEHASTSGKDQAGVGGLCRDRGNISLSLKAITSFHGCKQSKVALLVG